MKKKIKKNKKKEILFSIIQDNYEQGSILADDEKKEEREELLEQTKHRGYTSEMTIDEREDWEKIKLTLLDKFTLTFDVFFRLMLPIIFFPFFLFDLYIKILKLLNYDIEDDLKKHIEKIKREKDFYNKLHKDETTENPPL